MQLQSKVPVPEIPGIIANTKQEKAKKRKAERGVETMFRVTANNQMRLSEMADNKAHILLTINSIIVSVLLSFVFRKLDQEPQLTPAVGSFSYYLFAYRGICHFSNYA
jgi:hypothetical protein